MREPTTIKQKMVLECIDVFIRENGYSPTYRELGEELGLDPTSVFQIVMKLQDKGYLSTKNGKQRTIRLIDYDGC
jgi:repressor LexA